MTMIDQQLGAAAVPKEVWQDSAELHRCLNRSDHQEGHSPHRYRAGRLVFDLGCGPGGFLSSGSDAAARVTGPHALPQGSSSYLRSRRPY